ncbi:MAG: hypothetical protein PVJ43_02845 [Gemmatimonadales bacterium]
MKTAVVVLVFSALGLASGAQIVRPVQTVYLFDCQGRVLRLQGPDFSDRTLRHVTEIDSTLPERVRDGCAIHRGWFDGARDRLLLIVQTEAGQDENDSLPTKLIELEDFAPLREIPRSTSSARPGGPDRKEVAVRLTSLRAPFSRSMAYILADGVTALLQELVPGRGAEGPVTLDTGWEAGAVELQRARSEATGRYAVVDLRTGTWRGEVVATEEGVADARVVCLTPSGLVFLATARDALLVLDVMDPKRNQTIAGVELDLHWTACASN